MSRTVFLAALVCAGPAIAETQYFARASDVPLPPGFAEIDEGWAMVVDGGQLTEMRAAGPTPAAAVRTFYIESLSALGWSLSPQANDDLVFLRGREQLLFSLSAPRGGATLLRARLLVQPASMNAD